MKKYLLGFLVLAALVVAGVLPQAAQAATSIKIRGTVTNFGQPLVGIRVVAVCDGGAFDGLPLGDDNTDINGNYTINAFSDCELGSPVKITADTDGDRQPETSVYGTLQPLTTLDVAVSRDPVGTDGQFIIAGLVTSNVTKQPLPNTTVLIRCGITGYRTTLQTDVTGRYRTTITFAECNRGTSVYVLVGYDFDFHRLYRNAGSRWDTARNGLEHMDIVVYRQGTIEVPEFGWLGGALAAGTGLTGLVLMRQRLQPGRTSTDKE